MSFECLKADKRRTTLLRHWTEWMREADRWYCRYVEEVGESPFDFHEVAAVGFLSAAAARAGFLTLNEYQLYKRSQNDFRKWVPGRADLWMLKDGTSYSFEFKRAWYRATLGNLRRTMETVRGDIKAVPPDECHYAAGGVIAFVKDAERASKYEEFSNSSDVDVAYRIGPQNGGGAFLFFSIKS